MSVLERVREVERMQGAVEPGAASLRGARERLKADLVDRLGLDAMAGMLAGEGGARARAELSVALESALNTGEYEDVALCDRASLVDQVLDEVCGLGPIQPLLEDDSITEVMINGCDALFYERGGEICQAETRFDSPEQIMIAIDRILAPLGRRLDRASPLVSARLPNGDRVNAVADPISIDGPSITIRKFSDRAWTLRRLVGLGGASGLVRDPAVLGGEDQVRHCRGGRDGLRQDDAAQRPLVRDRAARANRDHRGLGGAEV